MSKRSIIVVLALILCLAFAQSAFAEGKEYPNEYRIFDVKAGDDEFYTLAEAYWFNPTVYSVEVLEFLQAYLSPEDPVTFFMDEAMLSDEEIDQQAIIFQSFLEPEYVGAIPFGYVCDIEALAEMLGYDLFDPAGQYDLSYHFESPSFFVELFPRGIGRANAYDTFRRCALQLAIYTSIHGQTPSFQLCYDYIQDAFAYYEEQFNAAMEAEAEAGMNVPETPEAEPAEAQTN